MTPILGLSNKLGKSSRVSSSGWRESLVTVSKLSSDRVLNLVSSAAGMSTTAERAIASSTRKRNVLSLWNTERRKGKTRV